MRKTRCSKTLFFITRGRESFRYQLCDHYKQKRHRFDEDFRSLLKALKIAIVERYPLKKGARIQGEHCFEYEADDIISFYKKKDPKNYVIASMDKDILYSNRGSHFNLKTNASLKKLFSLKNPKDLILKEFLETFLSLIF
ncbi:hypothetical protein Kyoto80A_00300 [Helicobacter pylori]